MKQTLTFFLLFILMLAGNRAAGQETASCDAGRPVGFAALDSLPTGGEGGQHRVVTTADQLEKALKDPAPLTIYIKGSIVVNEMISVQARNKTLLGLKGSQLTNPQRTREGSGILFFKSGSENLILRNLTFKSAGAYDVDGRDNLCIEKTRRIWVDHCDFQDGVDGNFDCKNASDLISVTWCRFRYLVSPKSGGSGGSDDHRFSNLWGSGDQHTEDRGHLRTTFQFCWWDKGCRDRMPRVRFAQVHVVNCLYSSPVTNHCFGVGKEADILVEKSVFVNIKPKNIYKLHNSDGSIRLSQCLPEQGVAAAAGLPSGTIPPYTLPHVLPASKVRGVVCRYAGATLNIQEPQ